MASIASRSAAATFIVASDPLWIVVAANDAAQALFETSPQELVGSTLAELLETPRSRECPLEHSSMSAVLAQVAGDCQAAILTTASHKAENWLLWPVLDSRGQASHVVCQQVDGASAVGENARDALEGRCQLATEAAELGVWDYDPQSGIIHSSQRCKDLCGIPRDARMTYDLFLAALHVDDRQRVDGCLQAALDPAGDGVYDVECRVVGLRDGLQRWIRAVGRALIEGDRPVRFVGIVQDITDRKQREEAQSDTNHANDQFVSTLAHELRNPLNPISVSLEMMAFVEAGSREFEDMRQIMQRQLRQVLRMIDGLLDVSRVSRGKIELCRQRVLLAEVVEQAINENQELIESAGHRLKRQLTPMPLVVEADAARLRQIISNLLQNAVRFTEPGGVISVTTDKEDQWCVIRVRDTGIGIAPDVLPRVFDMFMRTDRSLSQNQGGLGIGLTLVKHLVRLHGGEIEATSAGPGNGSEFTVRLPLGVASPRGGSAADRPPLLRQLKPRRVLVLDDTHDAAIMLGKLLTALGQHVDIVHDGNAALAAALRNKPDLVISDIAMPGMDGYEFARRFRAYEPFRHVTLIALTGYGQEQDRRRAMEVGFDQHLVKPITLKTLESLLSDNSAAC